MNYVEQTVGFTCQGEHMVGIVAKPEAPAAVGVVVIVGGPQYRAGSHRQFVLLSRALAQRGIAVLRFDYRGMGDSGGELRDFEAVTSDVGAAIDALQQAVPTVSRMALWGLCDGASAALLYCHETADPRVAGLCLLNPWVRSEVGLAKTRVKHYYVQRLRQKEFWLKLSSGKVTVQALKSLAGNLQAAFFKRSPQPDPEKSVPYQRRMALSWYKFTGSILLILSGDDYTAKEFLEHAATDPAWRGVLANPKVARHDMAGADHTFSEKSTSFAAFNATKHWLRASIESGTVTR